MNNKRVIVTGATGFIGSHVVPLLVNDGYNVCAVYNSNAVKVDRSLCDYYKVNLLDSAETKKFISNVRAEYLLHLAWEARPGIYWTSPDNLEWAQASIELFKEFYKQGGKRGVSAGTCAEYLWDKRESFDEQTSILRPASLYGACKLGFSQMIEAFSREKGYSYASGKIFFTFGPKENAGRLVPTVIQALLRGKDAKTTDGLQIRDFIYVEDVARAFIALLESDCIGSVNIGSGKGYVLYDIITKLAEELNGLHLIQRGALTVSQNEPATLVADVRRLQNELHFEQAFTIDQALLKTIAWWKSNS